MAFMTRAEVATFLLEDADGYVASLSQTDLFARGFATRAGYAEHAASHAADFRPGEARAMALAAAETDAFFSSVPELRRIGTTRYRLARVSGKCYENGWPHTRGDVVMVTDSFAAAGPAAMADTLAHERTHVFQRLSDLDEVSLVADHLGMRRMEPRRGQARALARANPDLDSRRYVGYHGTVYASSRPSSMSDVVPAAAGEYEQPVE